MIDDPAIDLFRHTVVKAAVSGLHMKDRNSPAGGREGRKGTVGVTEDQDAIGGVFDDHFVAFCYDLPDLVGERGRLDPEMLVRRSYLKIADKDVAQTFVVILTRVHGYVLAMLVEHLHHQAEPDDLGTGAEDGHYFHNKQ